MGHAGRVAIFRRENHSQKVIKVLTRTATLYTRDRESVLLTAEPVDPADLVWRLTVQGPGEAVRTHDFNDAGVLSLFQESLERDLVERGFRLQATAERRRGMDRRQVIRIDSVDRRRSDGE
jgi:hypothetical protein